MKIDSDLRAAIRAAYKLQNNRDHWKERLERTQKALQEFFKANPAIAKKCERAKAKLLALGIVTQQLHEYLASLGLRTDTTRGFAVVDDEAFIKAGGAIADEVKPWSVDAVLAQLAAASPEHGAKILADLGIRWE